MLFITIATVLLDSDLLTPRGFAVETADAYRRSALRNEGDFENGRKLFFDEQTLGCSRCHSIDGSRSKVGPDLSAVGEKFGRREIIDAVLSPSKFISVGYSSTEIVCKDGNEYLGVIKSVSDGSVELMDANSNTIAISAAEIVRQTTGDISLMPEGLHTGLSLEEFTDLIEFLVSLKLPENSMLVHHAMPKRITESSAPVRFLPYHSDEHQFEHPVWFGQIPSRPGQFLVLEHETGRIWLFEKQADGDRKEVFGELGQFHKGTRGSLGLVLHPQFCSNGKYYYAKHIVEEGRFVTVICEREAKPDGRADSGRESRCLLRFEGDTNVHYGGGLAFGPDGYLYVGMGDSGPQEDPRGNGQNRQLFLGKMLRIDVDRRDAGRGYAIPSDNPFAGRSDTRPEIWALGFREPWRFSFDGDDLWVGDVGQDRYEEVAIVRAGENHGWNVFEGVEPFSNRYRRSDESYVPPIFAYPRSRGISVTGGYVYRGTENPQFVGVYICGDYESRRVWGLTQENRVLTKVLQIGTAPQRIVSFAQAENGDLFLVGYEGTIYKIELSDATFR